MRADHVITLRVQARELREGDVLRGSRQTVTRVSHPNYRGCTWLHLRTHRGVERTANFHASTTLTIDRKA